MSSDTQLDRGSRKVLAAIKDWRVKFEGGSVRVRGIRQPRLEPGERLAVRIPAVGAGGSGQGRTRGFLWVTDRRAFILGNRPDDIRREWRWEDLDAVRVTPDWNGVRLSRGGNVDVITSRTGGRPTPRRLGTWLKVEGGFALAQNRADEWLRELPDRLAQ
jgi:hypothetical protein